MNATPLHAVDGQLSRDELERILAVWQHRLRLDHWRIEIAWDRPLDDDDAEGEVQCAEHCDSATVRLATGCTGWTRARASAVVVHELVHVVCRDMDALVDAAKLAMGDQTHVLFADRYEHETEGVVERLATVLAELAGTV